MKRTKWALPLGGLILGLSLVSAVHARASDAAASYSAAALYNLGNSYAREGQPALAVLNYERARLLAPRDPDILANLTHERESASLPVGPTRFEDHLRVLSPNAGYWLGLTGLVLAGVSGLLLLLKKSSRVAWGAALGGGLLMMALTLGDAIATAPLMHEAVVMQSAPASASPISAAGTLFTIPPGTLVQVQDEHANYALIRDPRGEIGWVPRAQITPVIETEGDLHG